MKKLDELPLVFMTVLTQVSLGGFFTFFLGDVLSIIGLESSNWLMASLVLLPAVMGFIFSSYYLDRSYFSFSIIKNIKTSWLSREAFSLGVFTLLMTMVVSLHFIEAHIVLRITTEAFTLAVGIYGIYAQSMVYRVKSRPSWDRETTNIKFFSVAYVGVFLLALFAVVFSMLDIAIPLIILGMIGSLAQTFFSFEDLMIVETKPQLKKTKRLYDLIFKHVKLFRFISIILGGLSMPLVVMLQISEDFTAAASFTLLISLILVFASEISDRYLFYVTAMPLEINDEVSTDKQRA